MSNRRILGVLGLILVMITLFVTACQGTDVVAPPNAETTNDNNQEPIGGQEGTAAESEATLSPAEEFPDVLVVHPDASEFEINAASGTYIYIVPLMVTETANYMLTELKDKGWEELGQPTIMGHLATLNLQMDKSRLTVSMQDNERTQTTRVQMLFIE